MNRARTEAREQNFKNTLSLISPNLAMAGQGLSAAASGVGAQTSLAQAGELTPFQEESLDLRRKEGARGEDRADRAEDRADRGLDIQEGKAKQAALDKQARGERLDRSEKRSIDEAGRSERRLSLTEAAQKATAKTKGEKNAEGRLTNKQRRLDAINKRFDKKGFNPTAANLASRKRLQDEIDVERAKVQSAGGGATVSPSTTRASRLFGEIQASRETFERSTPPGSIGRFFGREQKPSEAEKNEQKVEGQINNLFTAGTGAGGLTPVQVIEKLQEDNPQASVDQIIQGAIQRGLILER